MKQLRQVTKDTIPCFVQDIPTGKSNTTVTVENGKTKLFLFGNLIAWKDTGSGKPITITDAGWQSNVTKERLNAIPGVSISQKNWKW